MESLDSEFAYVPKRTPDEWLRDPEFAGTEALDWDGWRTPDAPGRDEPITLVEFRLRLAACTVKPRDAVDLTPLTTRTEDGQVVLSDALSGLPDGSISLDLDQDLADREEDHHVCAEQAEHVSHPAVAVLGFQPYVLIQLTIDGDGEPGIDLRWGGGVNCRHRVRHLLVALIHAIGPLTEDEMSTLTEPCDDE